MRTKKATSSLYIEGVISAKVSIPEQEEPNDREARITVIAQGGPFIIMLDDAGTVEKLMEALRSTLPYLPPGTMPAGVQSVTLY